MRPSVPARGRAASWRGGRPCGRRSKTAQDGRKSPKLPSRVGESVLPGGGQIRRDLLGKRLQELFPLQATITYDMPALWPWPSGSNTHGETLTERCQANVVAPPTLTANFAISSVSNLPAAFTGPYVQQFPQIVATNENSLGWYCWSPGDAPDGQSDGGYYVPAWNDFVFNGTSWVDTLEFTVVGAGLLPTDPRGVAILASYDNGLSDEDIFTSQSSALKISNWQSSLNLDPGVLYETGQDLSDVSVFLVPEPTTLTLLGLAGLALLWRRRTAKA